MKWTIGIFALLALAAELTPIRTIRPVHAQEASPFSFAATADMRKYSSAGAYDNPDYFKGALQAIQAQGNSAFMVSPGDIDPVGNVMWTIEDVMGTDYLWYPVAGNHDLPGDGDESYSGENIELLRAYDYDQNGVGVQPDIVNTGPPGCPETTYSFDYENAHFVVLNEYCDTTGDAVTNGNVSDHLFNWLVQDLMATTQQHIFVIGHEPAFPQPDADSGRTRHEYDSLNAYPTHRDRFWSLLRDKGVIAYICGHTHNYSSYYYDGVWQIDVGHARGVADTGAPSTFVIIHVNGDTVTFNAYRDEHDGEYDYIDIVHSGTIYDGGDNCPTDPNKTQPGICGCNIPDNDSDEDGTPDCQDTDDDGDGLVDKEEQGPGGDNPNYDGNGDGIPDRQQGNVASFHTNDDLNYVTMASPFGTIITDCGAEDNPATSTSPADVSFSHGFFKFSIEGVGVGNATAVTFYLTSEEVFDTYYKFGPTPDNLSEHWYKFLYDGQIGARIIGNVVTLHFVDGMIGDDDLTANGTISDIGGPGIVQSAVDNGSGGSGGGGGGGCFISTASF